MASTTEADGAAADVVVDALLAALTGGEPEAARGLVAREVWDGGLDKVAADLARRGGTLVRAGEQVTASDRRVVWLDRGVETRRARVALLVQRAGDDDARTWEAAGVTSDAAVARAFLLRWVDGTTRFDSLPESLPAAAWVTALAAGIHQGLSPRELVAADRVAADAEARAVAVDQLAYALEAAGPRPQVAVLGARALPATGRVAAGLALMAEGGLPEPVWFFLDPRREETGPRYQLVRTAGGPSLRGLVVGGRLDAAWRLLMAPRPAEAGPDGVDAALAKLTGPSPVAGLDARLVRVLAGLQRALTADAPEDEPAAPPSSAPQGPADSGAVLVSELFRAAIEAWRRGAATPPSEPEG